MGIATKVSVSALGTADKDGWLTKQGGKIKTWKKRWFVLKGDTLYYFKTQKDSEQTGEIKLLSTSACTPEPGKSKGKKYQFSVGPPSRVYYIFDETEKGMQQWVDKISKTIDGIGNNNSPSTGIVGGDGGGSNPTPSPAPVNPDPEPSPSPEPSPPIGSDV